MTKTTAGSLRAGTLPVFAALAALCLSTGSAGRASAADVTDPAIAQAAAPASTQGAKAGEPQTAKPDEKPAAAAAPASGAMSAQAATAPAAPPSNQAAATQPMGPPKPADLGKDAAAAKPADAKSADAKPADAKSAETKPADTKTPETKTPDIKTAAINAPDAKSPETKAPDAKATGTPADGKPAEAKPADTKPADAAADAKPVATAALPSPANGIVDGAVPPADPIVAEVRKKLSGAGKSAEAAALSGFYDAYNGHAVWVSSEGLTPKGKAVAKEFERADDWGLPSGDFPMPQLSGSLTPEAAADAEIRIAQLVLKYARYARGGRINPGSISQLMDVSLTLVEPKRILADITILDAPDAYLRSLHPKHVQFELLRQALLKARGTAGREEEEIPTEDPALSVKLPPGGVLRPGSQDPQIALLRQRLKVPAEDKAQENVYDDQLANAVKEFQRANSLRDDAIVGNGTRAVLNGQPKPVPPTSDARIERILINMERWRWLPEDLGSFYVWDNVPEALTRVVKDGKIIHTDKIVVGQPSWPTPFFSADMKTVVFHPTWGVPEGIKAKELGPILRKSSGGGLFGMFGGGYSAQAVLDAYQLRAYVNGRQVDANSIDWGSVDMRSVSFQQPPGPKNPLGTIKFLFPNKHDVYMHDTPERELFSRSFRALSHGCMRINDPRRFAEVILGEDKGWSPEKVRGMFSSGSADVALTKHIPVHVTYLTARVDENGRLQTYQDFYGLDGRTAAALGNRNVRFEQPVVAPEDDVTASADDPTASLSPGSPQQKKNRKKQLGGPQTLSDAISGLFDP